MNDLQRFDNSGIELIINTKTGEVFATQGMLAKICNQEQTSIRYHLQKWGVGESLKDISVKDSKGVEQLSKLYNEEAIYEILAKYKPELLVQCAKAGIRVYLHTLAGFTVSSTATKKELSPLEILEQQVRLMRQQQDDLDKLKLQVQEFNEFKQEMLDVRDNTLAEFKKLPEPSVAVAELKTKERLNRMVRDYAIANNIPFGTVYNKLYMEFRDRYHIDLKVRGNNQKPKLSGTEYADSINMIEQLYAVASEVFV